MKAGKSQKQPPQLAGGASKKIAGGKLHTLFTGRIGLGGK